MITDPEQKIARPRQVFAGQAARDVVPIENRVVIVPAPTA
jgi:citrate synthase